MRNTSSTQKKSLQLKFNIPFCRSRCNHCTIETFIGASAAEIENCVAALQSRLTSFSERLAEYQVACVALQGGTPSLAGPTAIGELIQTIKKQCDTTSDTEILLEVLPGTMLSADVERYRAAGVTRMNINMLTADLREHRMLHRPYDVTDMRCITASLSQANFYTYGCTICYDLPGQTESALRRSIETAAGCGAVSISLRALSTPEKRALCQNLHINETDFGNLLLTNKNRQSQLRNTAAVLLKRFGYREYVANEYSLPDFESKNRIHREQGNAYITFGNGRTTLVTSPDSSPGLSQFCVHPG